ncbi:MAG: hypothetical protein V3W41_22190 [Planctomycetota bacterium]
MSEPAIRQLSLAFRETVTMRLTVDLGNLSTQQRKHLARLVKLNMPAGQGLAILAAFADGRDYRGIGHQVEELQVRLDAALEQVPQTSIDGWTEGLE